MNESKASHNFMLVMTTEADNPKAYKMAKVLLMEKVVACVSLIETKSFYWWMEELTQAEEIQLLIKTKVSNLKETLASIKKYHSLETPDIIFFPFSTDEAYGKWLDQVSN